MDVGFDHVQKFGPSDEPYMRLEPWLKTARRAGYSVSTSGGGDLGYYVSGSYDAIQGVLPNDHEKRQVLRGNFDLRPAGKLALALSTSFTSDDIGIGSGQTFGSEVHRTRLRTNWCFREGSHRRFSPGTSPCTSHSSADDSSMDELAKTHA